MRRWASLLTLLVLTSACATSPQTRQLIENPPDIPARVELSEVPFFPQLEFHCGPASLASIFNYRGTPVEPNQIAELIYLPQRQGSLRSEVIAATRQFDLLPVQLDGRLESLMRELTAGNPIFVLQNLGLDSIPVWHYEVVVGYDFTNRYMILRSGSNRRVLRSFSLFEKTWRRAGYWSLAVVRPDTVPVTASAASYLDAVIGMEQVGRVESANNAYASALRRWPNNLLALMGQGNSAYTMGNYKAAEQAYRSALLLEPQKAEAWNNLAYALLRLGRYESSIDAINHALKLEPANQNFKDSYDELVNWSH